MPFRPPLEAAFQATRADALTRRQAWLLPGASTAATLLLLPSLLQEAHAKFP